jgi:hypothetical protein
MKFDPPIQFPVRVYGKRIIANVVEQYGSSDQFVLRVRFSDGFEDIFHLNEDGNIFGSTDRSHPYEISLNKDISILIGMDKNRNYHVIEAMIDDVITNVWIIDRSDSSTAVVYAVYYNNLYRFELKRNKNTWIAFSKSKLSPVINQAIRERVEELLNRDLK